MMSTHSVEMASTDATGGHHQHHLQQHHQLQQHQQHLGDLLLVEAHDNTTCYYFVCRLCALKCGQMTSNNDRDDSGTNSGGVLIFSDEGELHQVRKKIHDVLHFIVHDGDKFPRTVCRDCLLRLDESYEFLVKCLESQQFLANLATHEVFDTIYEQLPKQNHLQIQQHQPQQQQHLALAPQLTSATTTSTAIASTIDDTTTTNGTTSAATPSTLVISANMDDSLPDTSTIAADLDQLVDVANLHCHQHHHEQQHHNHHHMIQFEHNAPDDDDHIDAVVSMAQHMEQLVAGDLVGNDGDAHIDETRIDVNDDDSLPEITLYSFDGIGTDNDDDVADAIVKAPDETTFDLDDAAASFQVDNDIEYAAVDAVTRNDLYQDSIPTNAIDASTAAVPDELEIAVDEHKAPTQSIDVTDRCNATNVADAIRASTVNQTSRERHMIHGKVCTVCAKTFTTTYKLKVHMRTHTNQRPFHCTYDGCSKTFRSKCGLAQHGAQHTGQHQFACELCGKGFQVRSYLTSHMKCHSEAKPFRCGECGEQFRARQTLVDHEARHLGTKAFQCGSCEQRFVSKALRVRHEKLVHSSRGAGDGGQIGNKRTEEQPQLLFGCTVCEKQFVRQSYLKTHMFSHTGERPFPCDLCDRRMSTANDLKLHRRTHTGDAAYVCETCGKVFKRCDSLAIHRRSHTGERPYACSHCDQRFTQLTAMKLHRRLHTGERPYGCPVCPLWFVSGSILKQHMKKHDDGNKTPQIELSSTQS